MRIPPAFTVNRKSKTRRIKRDAGENIARDGVKGEGEGPTQRVVGKRLGRKCVVVEHEGDSAMSFTRRRALRPSQNVIPTCLRMSGQKLAIVFHGASVRGGCARVKRRSVVRRKTRDGNRPVSLSSVNGVNCKRRTLNGVWYVGGERGEPGDQCRGHEYAMRVRVCENDSNLTNDDEDEIIVFIDSANTDWPPLRSCASYFYCFLLFTSHAVMITLSRTVFTSRRTLEPAAAVSCGGGVGGDRGVGGGCGGGAPVVSCCPAAAACGPRTPRPPLAALSSRRCRVTRGNPSGEGGGEMSFRRNVVSRTTRLFVPHKCYDTRPSSRPWPHLVKYALNTVMRHNEMALGLQRINAQYYTLCTLCQGGLTRTCNRTASVTIVKTYRPTVLHYLQFSIIGGWLQATRSRRTCVCTAVLLDISEEAAFFTLALYLYPKAAHELRAHLKFD